MPTISDKQYNDAKAILVRAGSKSAAASHVKHGNDGGSPESHGKALLVESRDELVGLANKLTDPAKKEEAVKKAKAATREAASKMGISSW